MTFRLVAQCLKQIRHRVTQILNETNINYKLIFIKLCPEYLAI